MVISTAASAADSSKCMGMLVNNLKQVTINCEQMLRTSIYTVDKHLVIKDKYSFYVRKISFNPVVPTNLF